MRAPANEVGAAVLALARSGSGEAIAQLTRWLAESGTPAETANDLLIIAGWQIHKSHLKQLWGSRKPFHVRKASDGEARLFESSSVECPACEAPLLCLLRDASRRIVPFPLFTCANCAPADIEPYYVEVDQDDTPKALVLQELDEDHEPTFRRDRAPSALPVALEPASWAVPDDIHEFERVTRIGGCPSWVQSPQSAGACPKCAAPMAFLAQFPDPPAEIWGGEIWSGDTGMLYVFGCSTCRIAASFVQCA